ncbi:hypothetical protein LTR62_000288 [Meristemomyces frigidus]|uniref:Enhancer of mRNA-decapping protein 3 n=1 Tax=Meristemomyces frigidus TaxID=1508187 RepID=A0AAN7YL68_9PEZI|nr:hypothetical protein LTR62_000288 [Meristemomyces frigidus]
MADFTGTTVQITLKQSNTILHGTVRGIVAGQTLTLDNAYIPASGAVLGRREVESTEIADLQVLTGLPRAPTVPAAPAGRPPTTTRNPPSFAYPLPQQQQQRPTFANPPLVLQRPQPAQPAAFADPAILSYGKSPAPARVAQSQPVEVPATPVKSTFTRAADTLPVVGNGSPFVAEPDSVRLEQGRKTSRIQSKSERTSSPLNVARDSRAASGLGIHNGNAGEGMGQAENGARKKNTRRGQKKKLSPPTSSDPPIMNIEVSRNGNDMEADVKRGKGWRQTPLLQPSPTVGGLAPPAHGKKQTRRERKQQAEARNGWATEDATDVQDMGDFDFEASNKLFDKQTVFNELRQGDTTADEDRLVSHNKTRPGTYGGKNLHPTENVLSPPLAATKYASNEAESTSDADTEANIASGRSSSRHSASRSLLAKKVSSRQSSAQADIKHHPLATSVTSERGGTARSVTSLASRSKPNAVRAGTSPMMPDRTHSPQSMMSFGNSKVSMATSSAPVEVHFVIQHTGAVCPVLHPEALDTLELETVSRYGLSREAITETAARAVAETAMNIFDPSPQSRRGSRTTLTARGTASMTSSLVLERIPILNPTQSPPPVIVILAGNNSLGARAIAAARHLVSRGNKLIVAEASHAARPEHPDMTAQRSIAKRLHKAGKDIKLGNWTKASNYIRSLPGPPAVIIDALLAGTTYEALCHEASPEVQQEARAIIDWANRSRAPVLSLGCPSGVSGLDGTATLVEGEPLTVRPDRVLSFAAPMSGVLEAMRGGERWECEVVDLGLNISLRSEEVVGFGARWVGVLRVGEGSGAEADEGA